MKTNLPINRECLAQDIRQALLRRSHLDGPLKPAVEEYVRRVAVLRLPVTSRASWRILGALRSKKL